MHTELMVIDFFFLLTMNMNLNHAKFLFIFNIRVNYMNKCLRQEQTILAV